MDLSCTTIGIIHSPFNELKGMPIQPAGAAGVKGTIEVFEEFRPGLADLEGFSHIILLYHFHRSRSYELSVVPFLDTQPRGLFATRAPRRPNPIGLSVVRLDTVNDGLLSIQNVDILDGTPLLDIKPYVPDFDALGCDQNDGAAKELRLGWLDEARKQARDRQSDDRFV